MIKEKRRWNFEAREDGVYVCKGDHANTDCCQMEKLTQYEIVDILNELRAECLEYEAQMNYTHTKMH